jgi:hypothetical protein
MEGVMANEASIVAVKESNQLFEIVVSTDLSVSMDVSGYIIIGLSLLIFGYFFIRFVNFFQSNSFEIDEAVFGIGKQKIKLKPNNVDAQIAYNIWVELSTRKIGLPVDIEQDVIAEVYSSWYQFFGVTRELIKDIPAKKIKRKETRGIIKLSIDILNKGIRPHLTSWQAKFSRWYEKELENDSHNRKSPQQIQKEFPEYEVLINDLLEINKKLIEYRKMMYQLAIGKKAVE